VVSTTSAEVEFNWEEDSHTKTNTQCIEGKSNGRPRRERRFPTSLQDYQVYPDNSITDDGNLVQHLALMVNYEPISLDEAILSAVWRITMEDEIKSIEKNQTYEMVNLPRDKVPIEVKWVFKTKLKPDGLVAKYKARLVAKGFMQRKGLYASQHRTN